MRPRRALHWYGPAGLAALLAAGLTAGVVLALTRSVGEPLGPPPPAQRPAPAPRRQSFEVVALGDSITRGIGDPREQGYASRVVAALRRRGLEVGLRNLSASGAETRDLLERLAGEHVLREVRDADLVVVSIGGNDLMHTLRSASDRTEPADALETARVQMRDIVVRLRAANPAVPIRLVGLYNPFEVLPAAEPEARALLLAWNGALEAAAAAHRGVLVVPVADLFAERPDRLAADRFHPGPAGHALIAERVLSTLPEAEAR